MVAELPNIARQLGVNIPGVNNLGIGCEIIITTIYVYTLSHNSSTTIICEIPEPYDNHSRATPLYNSAIIQAFQQSIH
jgi:hypothetical protein